MDIYENGFFRQIKMRIKSHSVFGPILKKITILEPLMTLSTIISYCLDFGLDIFFCLQFYSMSLLKTKGSSESEMFYDWQDWFEYYIPLSSFFRTFAFLSLGIMTLSHIIMFLRAVSSQKMRLACNNLAIIIPWSLTFSGVIWATAPTIWNTSGYRTPVGQEGVEFFS